MGAMGTGKENGCVLQGVGRSDASAASADPGSAAGRDSWPVGSSAEPGDRERGRERRDMNMMIEGGMVVEGGRYCKRGERQERDRATAVNMY